MSGGIHTNTDAMDAHGKHLAGEITAALDKAHEAAASVELGPDVMGVLCQFWTSIFEEERASAERLLGQLPQSLEDSGNKVKEAAQEFRDRDDEAVARFEGMR
ncbi:excreted virulence factor EspC (type VII ESX diderm) [Halopolyspora algeriensis]|uniref:Excreted virulence factor EspC (Type VII ESX diderm) n=1 Tax=Halopolyspora algeriensis TaxID=1500506 RepID=A0A368VZJ4_9ACTN|nr:hypothetical protein [Halopolyspora algeriensis]RCW45074.1 excreted virulence factor EspC (type VII ESX diderm) [Halopolyspora algeriensis]TQM53201.1 excreted virulence factor EspC (type VII ESX diderm) [Halopolyspora algeriensis]